jgi:hypothetical protein
MRIIPNQPIIFDYQSPLSEVCCDPICFQDIRRQGDVDNIAIQLEPCEGTEGFVASGYTFSEDSDFRTVGETLSGSEGTATGTWDVTPDINYILRIEIVSLAPNATITVSFGTTTIVIDQTGVFFFNIEATTSTFTVSFTADGEVSFSTDNTQLIEQQTPPNIYLVDSDGEIVQQAILKDISNGVAVYAFEWPELECDEIYKFRLVDSCDNTCGVFGICNGFFDTEECWTIVDSDDAEWRIGDDIASFWGLNRGGVSTLTNSTELCAGVTYEISFSIISIDTTIARLRLFVGSEPVSPVLSATGSYIYTFTPSVNGSLVFEGTLIDDSEFLREMIGLDNVGVRGVGGVIAGVDSQEIKFACGPILCDHPEAKLAGCFAGFQFGFPSSFAPMTRIMAAIKQPQYEADLVKYKDSGGKHSIPYASTEKRYILAAFGVPEYLLDFIFRVWVFFDHAYVNQFTYVLGEETLPQITYPEQSNHGTFEMPLLLIRQLVVKKQCDFFQIPCDENPPPPAPFQSAEGAIYQEGTGINFEDGDGLQYN